MLDCWYFNKQVVRKIKEYKLNYVSELKSNRKVNINKRNKEIREHLLYTKMEKCSLKGKTYRAYSEIAYIKGIGKVKIVFSQQKTEDGWDRVRYFVTNMLWLNTKQTLSCYLVRTSIESFHKEAKQNLGLETFQFRKYVGVVTHLTCVLLAYLILLLARIKHRFGRTIGRLCNKVHQKAERLCLKVVWSLRSREISLTEVLSNIGLR